MLNRILYNKANINDEDMVNHVGTNDIQVTGRWVKSTSNYFNFFVHQPLVSAEILSTISMIHPMYYGLKNSLIKYMQNKSIAGKNLAKRFSLSTKTMFEQILNRDLYISIIWMQDLKNALLSCTRKKLLNLIHSGLLFTNSRNRENL